MGLPTHRQAVAAQGGAGMSALQVLISVLKVVVVITIITQVLAIVVLREWHSSTPSANDHHAQVIRLQTTTRTGSSTASDTVRMTVEVVSGSRPAGAGAQQQQQSTQQQSTQQQEQQQRRSPPPPPAAAASAPTVITPAMKEALSRPVLVAAMTGHFFGSEYIRDVPDCKFRDTGATFQCNWFNGGDPRTDSADAWWYHAPSFTSKGIHKARPEIKTVIMSMESAAYYGHLNDLAFMDQFDIEATYR
jgi:hypothetical protein